MPGVATATAWTVSVLDQTTVTLGAVSGVSTAGQFFDPLVGYFVSDPMFLSGAPVTASIIRWKATVSAEASMVVETSINNGASWDLATNNRRIPRLQPGDVDTRQVLVRVSLSRPSVDVDKPTVQLLFVQISTDVGTDEYVPIGHGFLTKVTTTSTGGTMGGSSSGGTSGGGVQSRGGGQQGGGTSVKLHAVDLSSAITRNKWLMQYTVKAGQTYDVAIVAMVKDRLPSQEDWLITSTTRQVPDVVIYGNDDNNDPWDDIRKFAQAIGFECFFNATGAFVFQPVADPRYGPAVWEFDSDNNPLVTEAQKELSGENTVNWVVVRGQSTSSSNAVSAEAKDDDPSSRTYVLGSWGINAERLTFTSITTVDQAQDTANAILYNSLGESETVTITCVPMPAIEPGDVIRINVPNVKASGTYTVQSVEISLNPGEPMRIIAFRQSTNTIDSAVAA